MNFNPFFNQVTQLPPVVTVNPPIITRRVRDIHRVFITEQPHILEDVTNVFNHNILRHTCCERPQCCEFCDFCEQNCCCNAPLPGPACPGIGQMY